jgi:outer membrane protein assembly factor BamA
VNRLILLCISVAACRHPQDAAATFPAVATVCSEARIGAVIVEGGTADDVPQLAVLQGTLDNPDRAARIAQVSAEQLRGRGYPRAAVTVAKRAGCGVELVVTVDKGPKFHIGSIEFVTRDEFPRRERLAAVEDALGTINSVGGAYVADRLERALEHLRSRYHELGWLEAEIDRPTARFDDARGLVHLVIPVRAGQRFKIGNVVARGGRRLARAAVIEALGLQGGQWYDAARLREGLVRARREVEDRVEVRIQRADDRIDLEAIVGGGQ